MVDQGTPVAGETLGPLTVEVTAERVRAYAEASGDFNPIHLDPVFATSTDFGAPIAHGMLLLAFIARVLSDRFGRLWVEQGDLEARFRAPALVGTTVVVEGTVQGLANQGTSLAVQCKLTCRDSNGQTLVTADAGVTLPAASM